MSSQSTPSAASDIIELTNQQIADDLTYEAGDAPAEQESVCQIEPSADGDVTPEDVHAAVASGAALALSTEAVAATADGTFEEPDPEITTDMLGQQLAQLVQSVGVVEELSRQARETATGDLARYDALAVSRQQYAERLEHACAIRDQARLMLERAFGQAARAAAQPLVFEAERVLQAFADLATAWQERTSAFLAKHPDVELLLSERLREQEHARRQEARLARARRLDVLVSSTEEALEQGLLVEGERLLAVLQREFPDQTATIDRLRLGLEQRVSAERDAAARRALADATEHQARGDLEAAIISLEQVDVHGLSEEVSQDVFGRWSETCSRLALTAGGHLVRFAPSQGRGLILYTDPAYPNGLVVLSSLGMGPGFPQGKVVTDAAILHRARVFREAAPLPVMSWTSAGTSPSATPATPIRH
jgi:hypothetical protein